MASGNQARVKVVLRSTAGTGVSYITTKNRRTHPDRLTLMKYDRIARQRVEFKEHR